MKHAMSSNKGLTLMAKVDQRVLYQVSVYNLIFFSSKMLC